MTVYWLAYVVHMVLVTFSVALTMNTFFAKRKTPLYLLLLSYAGYSIVSAIGFIFFNNPMLALSISFTGYFLITLNYKSSMIKRVVAIFSTFVLVFIGESLGFLVASSEVSLTEGFDIQSEWEGFIFSGMMVFTLALLFRNFRNLKKDPVYSLKTGLFFLIVPIITIILTVVSLIFSNIFTIFIAIIMLAILIPMFYLLNHISATYEDKLESALHAREKEYYFAQCELMQESVDKMKSYRHDVKLHLATLKAFSEKRNIDEIKAYLDSLLGNIGGSETYSDTGNIAFDSIINFKLKDVAENGIRLDINVFVPPTMHIEVADVVTILGNLLDNALDAVAKVEDKRITLDIGFTKESLFIRIDNTFDGEVKYAKGKDGVDAILTRKDGAGHGYGLRNVKKSVEKYNGHVEISHEENVFSVGILMYVGDM